MPKRYVDGINDQSETMKGTYVCKSDLFKGPMYAKETYLRGLCMPKRCLNGINDLSERRIWSASRMIRKRDL